MYQRALQGMEKAPGADHTSTLGTVNNLGLLYADQGKLNEAEKMYQRALQCYENVLGANFETYLPALNTTWNLASLCERQADLPQAKLMYAKALHGFTKVVGPDDSRSKRLRERLQALDAGIENNALEGEQEPLTMLPERSRSGERDRPIKSKRHKLLHKLGLR
jgi:tetratricopeptide (TPR) repeat protein